MRVLAIENFIAAILREPPFSAYRLKKAFALQLLEELDEMEFGDVDALRAEEESRFLEKISSYQYDSDVKASL